MLSSLSDGVVSRSGKSTPFLSIIIPAYNEEKRLPVALNQILAWRETVPFAVEIVVVENGSADRTTAVAKQYANQNPGLSVLHSEKGKGAAVKRGMLAANGRYLFICDSDLSMPIIEVEKFLTPEMNIYDVVIGSREAPGAVRYDEPHYRHVMGRVFNLIVALLAVPGFQDTQCGFKLFTKPAARAIFSQVEITGWTFDVEALYLARKLHYTITEVPIHWYFNADSRVRPLHDTWQMFWDVVKIRVNDWRGRYNKVQQAPVSAPVIK